MNKEIIKGHWHEIKGKIKQQWAAFTDDDVARMQGNFEELEGSLQKKYGYNKEKADKEIENFVSSNKWDDENH